MATGITKRHGKGCSARKGGRCSCNAGWEASVYSPRDGRKIRKTFARRWIERGAQPGWYYQDASGAWKQK